MSLPFSSFSFAACPHASATVDLNPGPAWWTPALGHYQLQVLSRPATGAPGRVSVAVVLPRPQLPGLAARSRGQDGAPGWTNDLDRGEEEERDEGALASQFRLQSSSASSSTRVVRESFLRCASLR